MTASCIQRLVEYIQRHGYRVNNPHLSAESRLGWRDRRVEAFAFAYKSPSFAWAACHYMGTRRIPFPLWLSEENPSLFKLYCYIVNPEVYRDPDIDQLLDLSSLSGASPRALLEALLVCRMSYENISEHMGMTVSAIKLYHDACFCVRARMDDANFLRNLIYPEGRINEILGNSLRTEAYDRLLLRAGFNQGYEDVLFFAGHSAGLVQALSDSAQRFEKTMMLNAALLARNGGIHDRSLHVVGMAKGLLQAKAISGDSSQTNDEATGMGAALQRQMNNIRAAREKAKPIDVEAEVTTLADMEVWTAPDKTDEATDLPKSDSTP